MQVHTVQPQGWLSYAIPIAIFVVIFGLRARRMTRLRPLKVERLWIVPAIYLAAVVGLFIQSPPTLTGWGAAILGLVAGAAVGWQRGKTMQIHVDPETHALNQKSSLAGIFFLVALVAVRGAARTEGSALMHLNVAMLTDGFAALALGMFAVQRLEIYLRATRLLEDARAGRI
jgi:predicted transporter